MATKVESADGTANQEVVANKEVEVEAHVVIAEPGEATGIAEPGVATESAVAEEVVMVEEASTNNLEKKDKRVKANTILKEKVIHSLTEEGQTEEEAIEVREEVEAEEVIPISEDEAVKEVEGVEEAIQMSITMTMNISQLRKMKMKAKNKAFHPKRSILSTIKYRQIKRN